MEGRQGWATGEDICFLFVDVFFYFLSMFSLKVRKYDEEEIRFTLSAKFHLFRLEHE